MKKRSPVAVLLLPLVTFGIYAIYWMVKTKGEMKKLGADIPTAWLIIIPLINIWWMWRYSQGVEKVTGEKLNAALVFIGFLLIGFIMGAIVQDSFNNVGGSVEAATAPAPAAAPVADAAPASTDQTPPNQPLVQ